MDTSIFSCRMGSLTDLKMVASGSKMRYGTPQLLRPPTSVTPKLLRCSALFSEADRIKSSISSVHECHFGLPLHLSTGLQVALRRHHSGRRHQCYGIMDDDFSSVSLTQESGHFVREAVNMNFFERASKAWKVLFPTRPKRGSNADIAKQRLKMILFSDRCAVSDEAKRKIVSNIVGALSDFVEIESEDKVQLNVSADPDLGTVYSVTVPVRRVKPEYQEYGVGFRDIRNIEYKDAGGEMRAVDIKLDYTSPNDGQA